MEEGCHDKESSMKEERKGSVLSYQKYPETWEKEGWEERSCYEEVGRGGSVPGLESCGIVSRQRSAGIVC